MCTVNEKTRKTHKTVNSQDFRVERKIYVFFIYFILPYGSTKIYYNRIKNECSVSKRDQLVIVNVKKIIEIIETWEKVGTLKSKIQ